MIHDESVPPGALPAGAGVVFEPLEQRVLLSVAPPFVPLPDHEGPIRVAVIGDYGQAPELEWWKIPWQVIPYQIPALKDPPMDVARLVRQWEPDLVLTVGDNNYPQGKAESIDRNIGRYYRQFIHPYQGNFGRGATENRFFPTLGNHDYYVPDAQPYHDYFTLPGNERYYDFVHGPVHFFALNSNWNEPDGITADSIQAQWLQEAMEASTATFKVVYMHHPPFSSGRGESPFMRWPFADWGADVVMAGHDHNYERLMGDDGVVYIVNGSGGSSIREVRRPGPNSARLYDRDFGALRIDADDDSLTLRFVNRNGRVIDRYTIEATATTIEQPAGLLSAAGPS